METKMKTYFFSFVVTTICVVGAAGQTNLATLSSQPYVYTAPSHTQHATQTSMPSGQNLMERGGTTAAQGERPLWEVMPLAPETPLGDSAREVRKEHAAAKKARIVWSN
jgi:hypothetical protein